MGCSRGTPLAVLPRVYRRSSTASYLLAGMIAASSGVHAATGPFIVPGNVIVAPQHRVLLETLLDRSPSFRQQCARIAQERSLTIQLRLTPAPLPGGVRAISHISRSRSGGIVAIGRLHPFDYVEMIAHEFEHIIEQLEGVDLPKLARERSGGVRLVNPVRPAYGTDRAVQAGRRVADEMQRNRLAREHMKSSAR